MGAERLVGVAAPRAPARRARDGTVLAIIPLSYLMIVLDITITAPPKIHEALHCSSSSLLARPTTNVEAAAG
jgi:hypothetical protein